MFWPPYKVAFLSTNFARCFFMSVLSLGLLFVGLLACGIVGESVYQRVLWARHIAIMNAQRYHYMRQRMLSRAAR
jgi:hypothetical protein